MIEMLLAGASIASSGLGLINTISGSSDAADAQQRITGLEQQAEAQRFKAMELDARRKEMEVLRNTQRARALALTSSVDSGSNKGSGLQGGYGQIFGDANWNITGINDNLEIGRALFGINSQISSAKGDLAKAQGQMQTGAALTSFGGSLMQSIGPARFLGGYGGGVTPAMSSTSYQSPYSDPSRRGSIY